MGRLFGTDGVRGVANKELTPKLAFDLGKAGAYVLTKHTNDAPKILVGTDGRISADMLESALSAGMCSVGAHVSLIGILPTPAVAFLVRHYGYDAGVVISASHNPAEYNGIKFFNGSGYKLPDALEDEIESLIMNDDSMNALPCPTGEDLGHRIEISNAVSDYVNFLKSTASTNLDGLNIAIDCANGASYKAAPLVFNELYANVSVINNKPNGKNINKDCGSTHMEELQKYVVDMKKDVGFAFDGDADRCLAVDEKGNVVDGDQIMTICANYMKSNESLKNNTVVATVMSNLGFFIMGKKNDITIKQTAVGDRYVLEHMLEHGYNLGGEQSGHIIFLDHNTTGDGILSAIKTLCVMKETKKPLSELAKQMTVLPQALVNAKVKNDNKHRYMEDNDIKTEIEKIEATYEGEGRVLIRASGTEPLVRVMIEGKDKEDIKLNAKALAKLIEDKLGK